MYGEHWASTAIQNAAIDGWVNGFEDGTFKPENVVTLAEFLKMLLSSSHEYLIVKSETIFPDAYLETAKQRNYLKENLEIDKSLTRFEVCEILASYIGTEDVKMAKNQFLDLKGKDDEAVLKLVQLGIICGYEDNTFRGNQEVTRAEAVVLIQRAQQAKKEKALHKEYEIKQCLTYCNYDGHEPIGTSMDQVSFQIENQNLYITDMGRYQVADNEKIKSQIFDVSKATKVIQNLVNEVGYVGVVFFPSEDFPNQLVISYGQNEKRVANNTNEINIIYYQDEYYNLKERSRIDVFSEKCYMKISISHLWEELHEFQNGNFVDECLMKRLEKGLEGEFGKTNTHQICEYIQEKIIETFSREDNYQMEMGQKTVGPYQIDYYKVENGIPAFYVSKR